MSGWCLGSRHWTRGQPDFWQQVVSIERSLWSERFPIGIRRQKGPLGGSLNDRWEWVESVRHGARRSGRRRGENSPVSGAGSAQAGGCGLGVLGQPASRATECVGARGSRVARGWGPKSCGVKSVTEPLAARTQALPVPRSGSDERHRGGKPGIDGDQDQESTVVLRLPEWGLTSTKR